MHYIDEYRSILKNQLLRGKDCDFGLIQITKKDILDEFTPFADDKFLSALFNSSTSEKDDKVANELIHIEKETILECLSEEFLTNITSSNNEYKISIDQYLKNKSEIIKKLGQETPQSESLKNKICMQVQDFMHKNRENIHSTCDNPETASFLKIAKYIKNEMGDEYLGVICNNDKKIMGLLKTLISEDKKNINFAKISKIYKSDDIQETMSSFSKLASQNSDNHNTSLKNLALKTKKISL